MNTIWKTGLTKKASRCRSQGLAAVGDTADPGCAMDIQPNVVVTT